ncbi:PBSX family phage terminase large subunit [Mycolicibacterium neoaurum]|uniref:PBSX family phage terminase large subunit n=1 Tax=Mycolicibacterium neoaurum TaxID=1795 RepID=UPI001F4D3383|nr:terminase large subunit [Mycolicibacterium neoaurum]
MAFQATTALHKIRRLRKRLRIVQGGARAGKTVAILMCLIDLATSNDGIVISVVSETMPHLKRGAIRDFIAIMTDRGYFKQDKWNRTDFIYTFGNGSIIEFFSADSPGKVHGPARDVLFINECNHVAFEVYQQLAMRTSRAIYLDFNPVAEFYAHTELLPRSDAEFLKLTYLDNEGLPAMIVREIEMLKKYPNKWRIYGLGEIGVNEGQVYENWIVDELEAPPPEAQLVRHALDFGYTNDPTAIVNIYKWNGGYVLDQVTYEPGLKNRPIANILRKDEGLDPLDELGHFVGKTKIRTVADSSEPKSIDEIKDCGVYIVGAVKGADSVNFGIDTVQLQTIWVTKRSLDIITEYRNYTWKQDKKTEKWLNDPIDAFNHALDAVRYAITDVVAGKEKVFRVRTA